MSEPNLRIPGPTPLPPSVREAGGRQMINHRGPEFAALLARVVAGMRPFFGTVGDPVILSAAGTGGLEAAVVNTLSPGDHVLAVSIGAFGDRFAKIAQIYGADVSRFEVDWGRAADPDDLHRRLAAARAPFRAVLLTHNETSTGVINPIADLVGVVREHAPDALVLVDSVSALGAAKFEMDAWGADVVVTGSQKAWMAAPGLAMVAASERAWEAMETARMPRFYLDLRRHRDSQADGQTPWTPALAVLYQVDEGLRLMAEEGADAVFARHEACAHAARDGFARLGFEGFADPRHASPTVTCVRIPDGIDWKAANGEVRARGVVLAGGQGKLAGQVIRMGHLGWVHPADVEAALDVIADVLAAPRPRG